ncbi:MAG TPA: threonine/serine dehydratase [Gemmatimonadales bacterium]|nr:threonine/serine dehydratase [Gemmatimonadales bacterium]
MSISRVQIQQVYEIIGPHLRVTPTLDVAGADFGLGPVRLTFKLEQPQYAGSFKTRGAFAHLLTRKIPAVGVVAASGGSHGVAVADAARRLGVRAKIFVPRVASPAKVDRIRGSGADLEIVGERYADALAASEAWAQSSGALVIHAFDQIETLLGQGTIGLELNHQAPALDTVIVPVGGGGLIAGVCSWYAGSAQVVGVEPEEAPTLTRAWAAGRPVDAPTGGIAAESLAPQRVGDLVFPIARAHVSKVTLVTDAAIRRAQHALWDQLRIVAEPGGATAFAALLSRAYLPRPDERVGVLVSGGNTADVTLSPVT